MKLTLGQEAHTALEQLVELFRHQNPSGDFTMIVERALCELLKSTMKRRFAQTNAAQPRVTRELTHPGPNGESNSQADVIATPKPDVVATAAPKIRAKSAPDVQAEIELVVDAKSGADVRIRTARDVEAKREEVRSPKSRYVPRAILRELYARDKGQCTYVSPEGRRCVELGFLEVHHHSTTFARGGEATAENLRLVCRAHNLFLAERDYGRGFMQDKLREAAGLKQ